MNWYKWQHMLEETRTAEAEVAPVEAAGREPWQMTREEFAGAFGSPDNWASVVRRNLEQGKDVPIAVRSELEAYDAQRASRSALPPEQDKAKVGDTVVRYTHADGSKLTDSEENELVELMDLSLRQPPEGTSGTSCRTRRTRATGTEEMIPVEGRGFKTRNRKASLERFRYQYDEESGTVSVCFHQMED